MGTRTQKTNLIKGKRGKRCVLFKTYFGNQCVPPAAPHFWTGGLCCGRAAQNVFWQSMCTTCCSTLLDRWPMLWVCSSKRILAINVYHLLLQTFGQVAYVVGVLLKTYFSNQYVPPLLQTFGQVAYVVGVLACY